MLVRQGARLLNIKKGRKKKTLFLESLRQLLILKSLFSVLDIKLLFSSSVWLRYPMRNSTGVGDCGVCMRGKLLFFKGQDPFSLDWIGIEHVSCTWTIAVGEERSYTKASEFSTPTTRLCLPLHLALCLKFLSETPREGKDLCVETNVELTLFQRRLNFSSNLPTTEMSGSH